MPNWIARLRHRFAALPLGVKLAWLSSGLTAIFIVVTLVPLSVSTRAATVRAITAELRVTQRVLLQNQTRELQRLESAAKLLGDNASLRAAIETEDPAQRGKALDPKLAHTAANVLSDALPTVNKDLIVLTDDSGRVFASASRGRDSVAAGTDLHLMPAVRLALDPALPADTGAFGVLALPHASVSVAAVPLVTGGRTLGAMILGQRIDSAFVDVTRAAFSGEVVVTAGTRVLSSTSLTLSGAMVMLGTATAADSASRMTIGGEEYIVAPLSLGQTQTGDAVTVWLLQPISALTGAVTGPMVAQFLIYGLIAIILIAIGAALVSRSVLRPLDDFIVHMRGVTPFSVPSRRFKGHIATSPEITALDESFTSLMVSLRESEAQLRQSQKLEAIGALADGVAHDFNNLLTVITGYAQLVMMRTKPEDSMRADLKQVIEASDRAATLTHQLLAFSRKQVLQPTVLDLGAVVDGVAPMLRRLIGEHITLLVVRDAPESLVVADRGQLEQVIINLVVNARDACPTGGTVTIRTAHNVHHGAPSALLSVRDTGTGISPEARERIFEPFFTTKEEGKGTGLGLSTVYGIVTQSGGSVEVESESGRGTTFTIHLPRAVDDATDESSTAKAEQSLPRGNETVLLIEDESDVRELARRTLEGLGYVVLTSANPDDAERIGRTARVDLVLADVVMPMMSGPQVIARLHDSGVRPVVVYMSGHTDENLGAYELNDGMPVLRKPFSPSDLARAIRSALDGAERAGSPLPTLHSPP